MDLIARLLAEPQRFEFVQAVRLLLLALDERGIPERRALARHLRFANSLKLAFPPSQLEAVAPDANGYRLTPAFMSLLGAHGALPLHVTERILALPADGGEADAARAFLDMFSTRMVALWYRAWQKYRVEHLGAGPRDAFLPMLLALAGVPAAGAFAADGSLTDPTLSARLFRLLGELVRTGSPAPRDFAECREPPRSVRAGRSSLNPGPRPDFRARSPAVASARNPT
jgi:type VI secretion system protein ImpH